MCICSICPASILADPVIVDTVYFLFDRQKGLGVKK
jgi:hypothetical protein